MREIKFRAWDEKAKEIRHDTLMQFTGMHDSNGREIYESDILGYGKNKAPHLVSWNNIKARWEWNTFQFSVTELPKLAVIGNIYENPELLS